MELIHIATYETPYTRLCIYKTNYTYWYSNNDTTEDLYVMITTNKKTNEEYCRYGNSTQVKSTINTYHGLQLVSGKDWRYNND